MGMKALGWRVIGLRGVALGLCLGVAVWPAGPARAAGLPPMDLARGELAVELGLPAAGADLSLGRLVIGGAAFGVPALVAYGYGFVAHAGWRLSGLPRRETCVGLALVGGAASTGFSGGSTEDWFVQPAIALAVPLGERATLRVAGGPVFLSSVRALGGSPRTAFTWIVPFVPSAELAFRLSEGNELIIGGLPNVVGWRGTF